MQTNVLQAIQQSLGIPEIKKIDPNTQETKDNPREDLGDKLNQAAVPAVLIGLYKYTRSNEGASAVLQGNISDNWLNTIFGELENDTVNKVAAYAGTNDIITREKMELIAKTAIGIIRESNPANTTAVKDLLAAQENNILTHLPPALQMGDLLNDTTIDDRTNKMEGPISSLVRKLSGQFSKSEKSKEDH